MPLAGDAAEPDEHGEEEEDRRVYAEVHSRDVDRDCCMEPANEETRKLRSFSQDPSGGLKRGHID